MDEVKVKAITRHTPSIVKNMKPRVIMDQLRNNLLTQEDIDNVKSKSTPQEKNRELLDILLRKGEANKPFEKFMTALRKEKDQRWLEKKIIHTYNNLIAGVADEISVSGSDGSSDSDVQYDCCCPKFSRRWFLLPCLIFALLFAAALIVYLNKGDNISRAVEYLIEYYEKRLFSDDYLLSTFSTTDIEKIWVDPTIEQNGKNDTNYLTLINDTFLYKDILLFEGDAGTGKSFLLRKIMHDWTVGRLPQFTLAVYFDFRHIKVSKDLIVDLIHSAIDSLFEKNSSVPSVIKSGISELAHNTTLVILDGYDEVHTSICGQLKREFSPVKGELLPATPFKIIISARSNYVQANKGRYGQARILGFDSWSQKENYIDKYFTISNNTADARNLKIRLKSTKFLMDWSKNPLYITFICAVFKQLTGSTELELYEKIVIHHMRVHGEKSSEYARSIFLKCGFQSEDDLYEIKAITENQWRNCSYLHKLGNLAFIKLFAAKGQLLEFSKADLSKYEISTANNSDFGFLMKVEINQEYVYRFRHKSFQEFFAAFYCNTFDNDQSNTNIQDKWYDKIAALIAKTAISKFYTPTEMEYFLFRYAVANFERGDWEQMRPLLQNYESIDFSFSKADIKTEMQLKQLLSEFVNISHLSLSGTLQNGNVSLPRMDNLRVLTFGEITFIDKNQIVSPLPMKDMLNLTSVTYRTCPWSMHNWQITIKAFLRSRQKIDLKIHCSRLVTNDSNYLVHFLKETVNCSKKVKKLSIYKDPEDNWPRYKKHSTNSSMTDVFTFILNNAHFEELSFTIHLTEYYKIRMNEFPSAKRKLKRGRDIFSVKLAVHRANSTLSLNLSQWGIETETQLHEVLTNKYAPNITRLSILGLLKKGNLTIPQMNQLRSIEFSKISFINPAYQSIYSPTRMQAPKLRTIKFLGCPWRTLKQWRHTVNSFSSGSLELTSLTFNCTEWSDSSSWTNADFFDELANFTMTMKRLKLFQDRNTIEKEAVFDERVIETMKQLVKKTNNMTLVLDQEFISNFGINMTQFVAYKTSTNKKRKIYEIQSEFIANNEKIVPSSRSTNATDALPSDVKGSHGIIWSFIRLINFTHITITGELHFNGKVRHQMIVVGNISMSNEYVLTNLTASTASDSEKLNQMAIAFDCCKWQDNKNFLSDFEMFCEDPHPVLILNITFDELSSKGSNRHRLMNHLTKLFKCKTAFDQNSVYVFDQVNSNTKEQFGPLNVKGSLHKSRKQQANNSDSIIRLQLKTVKKYSLSIDQILALSALPVRYSFTGHNFLSITVEVNSTEGEEKELNTTALFLDILQCGFTTEQQLYFYLTKFSKLKLLTLSGDINEGNLTLPAMPDLQTVKFLNVMFSDESQNINPLSRSHFKALAEIDYSSCPWTYSDIKNYSAVKLFVPRFRSLHSLCSSLTPLKKLVIRCPNWPSKFWSYLVNFLLEIINCSTKIDSVYLLKFPDDQWPDPDQKPEGISIFATLMTLIENVTFGKIIINEEFLKYNKISLIDLPYATKEKYLDMDVFVYQAKNKSKRIQPKKRASSEKSTDDSRTSNTNFFETIRNFGRGDEPNY